MALGDPPWVRNQPQKDEGPKMDWKAKALVVVPIAVGMAAYAVALWWICLK